MCVCARVRWVLLLAGWCNVVATNGEKSSIFFVVVQERRTHRYHGVVRPDSNKELAGEN